MNYNACSADLKEFKKSFEWLKEVDSVSLQSSIKDLDVAYQNFFREVKKGNSNQGFPKFKSKKNNHKSYKTKYTNGNIQVLDKNIKLPKLGLVKSKVSRGLEGRIINATISQEPSGKYFVSICCTEVLKPQIHLPKVDQMQSKNLPVVLVYHSNLPYTCCSNNSLTQETSLIAFANL